MDREAGRMLLLLVGKHPRDKIAFLFKKYFLCFFLSEWQRDGERGWKGAAGDGSGGGSSGSIWAISLFEKKRILNWGNKGNLGNVWRHILG